MYKRQLLIFHITNKDLLSAIKQYDIRQIVLSKDSVESVSYTHLGKRVAAEGCGDPFHREGQRASHIGGEGSESKGWKSAGCALSLIHI